MSLENPSPLTRPLPSALASVEADILRACNEARRDRTSVTLIAVSKTFEAEAITPIIQAGQHVYGENRVQEAKAKWPALMSVYPGMALHLIGTAAIQQGQGGRCAVRRHPFGRSSKRLRSVS